MPEPLPTDLAVGDVLDNAFRLESVIGEGGMGRVFVAIDLKLERRVAVKALLVKNLDAETVRRFDRETQVMGKLDHLNVVVLYGFGRTRSVPWLAMQLLEGQDLARTLAAAGGRLTPAQLWPIVRQTLGALQYVHGRGVLHRDLKPSNIHLGKTGKVTLCDFGLARGHTSTLTRTGVVWGTPEYMAPEQIAGERELDGRADLYALSAVMFRVLTGQLLFADKNEQELLRAHLNRPRPDPCRLVPGLSPMIGAALQKGLAIHAEDRFQSAAEMLQALELVFAPPAPRPRGPLEDDEPPEAPTSPEGFAPLNEPRDEPTTNREGFTELGGQSVTAGTAAVPWEEERTLAGEASSEPTPRQANTALRPALTAPKALLDSRDEEPKGASTDAMPALPVATKPGGVARGAGRRRGRALRSRPARRPLPALTYLATRPDGARALGAEG